VNYCDRGAPKKKRSNVNQPKTKQRGSLKVLVVDKWPSLSPTVDVNKRLAERRKETEWLAATTWIDTQKAQEYG
jgi:hypothetical protein